MNLIVALFILSIFPTAFCQLYSVNGEELTVYKAEQLRQLCPKEYKFCAEKIAEGRCYGNSKKANELKRKCPCSCNTVHHQRIQNCCKAIGRKELDFCLPLCAYNTTLETLGGGLGIKCVGELTTLAYCASDGTDSTECCRAKGVPDKCLSFCKGNIPTCDLQSIFEYKPCLKTMQHITECQKMNLTPTPKFDPEWESPCDE